VERFVTPAHCTITLDGALANNSGLQTATLSYNGRSERNNCVVVVDEASKIQAKTIKERLDYRQRCATHRHYLSDPYCYGAAERGRPDWPRAGSHVTVLGIFTMFIDTGLSENKPCSTERK
jgi:hypothetical protein